MSTTIVGDLTVTGENHTFDPATNTTTVWYGPRTPPLSEEACLKAGGHCYELSGSWLSGHHRRLCKHCGKEQRGTPQQDIRWEDA